MRSALLAAAVSILLASPALAKEPPGEVDALLQRLGQDELALSTDECASACRALSSMRRSADRICVLEPGPRCDDARSRVKAAGAKVVASCPGCARADGPSPTTQEVEPPRSPSPPATPPRGAVKAGPDQESTKVSGSPPEESRRGGCAGCVSAPGRAAGGEVLLVLAILAGLRRRRR